MPDFELYRRTNSRGGRRCQGETVTVNRHGYLAFSIDAFARLGSPAAVVYLIAEDERLIAFRPCEPGEADAHRVTSRARTMSARSLLRYMGVDYENARRYSLRVEDGKPPYIDLNEDAPVVTSNRRKAAQ